VKSPAHDLYVGYLPTPPRLRRFLRIAIPALLWALLAAALLLGRSQPDPGDAVWDTGTPRTFRGTLFAAPYPTVLLDEPFEGARACLVVEQGKHGAQARAAPLDGKHGWTLRRDGRTLIELAFEPDALREDTAIPAAAPPAIEARARVTLSGEIVDSKCYLGAMKPGEGKTHKECATLCIRAGPPAITSSRARPAAPSTPRCSR
jgi:hypothetical protein